MSQFRRNGPERGARRPAWKPRACLPRLEWLEDRCVPSALALKIESGATTVIVNDGGPGDLDGAVNNQISFQSGVGSPAVAGFSIQGESALTNSPGSPSGALLQT